MDAAAEILVRHAKQEDLDRVLQAYTAWGYRGTPTPGETILIAERGNELVGLVRMVPEQGTIVLRGMYVRPSDRRSGVGLQLLEAVTQWLGHRECYCVPYAQLTAFYRQGGFHQCDMAQAPSFLKNRLMDYRARGLDVLIMYRPKKSDAVTCW